MACRRTVKLDDQRRREAAGLFYFHRLRQRRAPLVVATGCRKPSRSLPPRRPPATREANRGDAHQGLAMLESLVEAAFTADTRLGTFLKSVASKETAAWDVVPGKFGVFPCSPPAFSTPGTLSRRSSRQARLRIVEQQLTGMIIAVLSFQVLGRPRTAPASCRMGWLR